MRLHGKANFQRGKANFERGLIVWLTSALSLAFSTAAQGQKQPSETEPVKSTKSAPGTKIDRGVLAPTMIRLGPGSWRHVRQKNDKLEGVPLRQAGHGKSTELYYGGREYMDNGNFDKAIECYCDYISAFKKESKSIKNEDKNSHDYYLSWGYQNRAYCYLMKNDYKSAIVDLTVAIALRPRYAPNYINRAKAYRITGKPELAAADLEKVRSLPKTSGDPYVDLPKEFPYKGKRKPAKPPAETGTESTVRAPEVRAPD